MSEFKGIQESGQAEIDDEYAVKFGTLPADVERELDKHKKAAKAGRDLTAAESAAVDQKVLLDLISSKLSQYISTAPGAYALYGHSPYFLMNVLPKWKIAESLAALQQDPYALYNSFGLIDNVYRAAMEIKRLSLLMGMLTGKLRAFAEERNAAESIQPRDHQAELKLQDERIFVIGREQDLNTQQLPDFLQHEVIAAAGAVDGKALSQTLTHYKTTLERLAASKIAEIRPVQETEAYRRNGLTINFSLNNPKIKPPLGKPELEALNELVHLQRTTPIGTKWLSSHDAILKAESARHLTAASYALSGLAERASDAEEMTSAIKFTVDFYKEVTEKFGERASVMAKELSASATGKKIRSAEEAIKAFDRYKSILDQKYSAKDRAAIARSLDSIDKEVMAKSLAMFGKVFGALGVGMDAASLVDEARKSTESGNWKPFFVKAESIVAGRALGALLVLMFGMTLATPLSILGFALVMAVTSSLVDDALMGKVNEIFYSN
ncbi:colicin-like pore-forming protein [Pseudomonas sp. IT-P12]|uniref:colicin-like pore-forming protein n=1 Tax=Pseudomonas sp. IT-P12 TaxID=3026450 RepID=UPI0039E12BA0